MIVGGLIYPVGVGLTELSLMIFGLSCGLKVLYE